MKEEKTVKESTKKQREKENPKLEPFLEGSKNR